MSSFCTVKTVHVDAVDSALVLQNKIVALANGGIITINGRILLTGVTSVAVPVLQIRDSVYYPILNSKFIWQSGDGKYVGDVDFQGTTGSMSFRILNGATIPDSGSWVLLNVVYPYRVGI